MTTSKQAQKGEKVVTLMSGGLDAACVVAWAAHQGYDQQALYFNYGQDGFEREFACARINTLRFNVPLELIDLSGFRAQLLGRYAFPLNVGKNILGGLISTFALATLTAGLGVLSDRFTMLAGIHGTDLALRPQIRKSMAALEETVGYFVGSLTDRKFRLLLPFAEVERVDVIRSGLERGVEFENTWSCQASFERPCGVCYSCQERANAFAQVGIPDPQIAVGGIRVPNISNPSR